MRWGLVALMQGADETLQRRALELIRRAAPGDTPGLLAQLKRWMSIDLNLVVGHVIPAVAPSAGLGAQLQLQAVAPSRKARRTPLERCGEGRAAAIAPDEACVHSAPPATDGLRPASYTSPRGEAG